MSRTPHETEPVDAAMRFDAEWLLTNGLGGFAMGTVPGVNTRRYHGLLVAATRPPVGRVVALHSTIDRFLPDAESNGAGLWLSSQRFGAEEVLHPGGHVRLCGFTQRPDHVRWAYDLAETGSAVRIDRLLRLAPGQNLATLEYRATGALPAGVFEIRPLVALRDFHELLRPGGAYAVRRVDERTLRVELDELALELSLNAGHWLERPDWWYDLRYPADRLRGQGSEESLFTPGVARCRLHANAAEAVVLEATLVRPGYRVAMPTRGYGDDVTGRLDAAADQFLVKRMWNEGDRWSTSVIAGYPWFADWGRDAMIALPGLCVSRGLFDEARDVLLTFARALGGGLIPNRFDDYGRTPHYNTADAPLWFVHAVGALAAQSQRHVDDVLLDACRSIVAAYRAGTAGPIGVDPSDGLVTAGDASTQLTWMDAARGGVVFTPRHGKAVEINALWHRALCVMAECLPEEEVTWRAAAAEFAAIFRERFWWAEQGCLHDVLSESGGAWQGDGHLRPNQIFAVSLDGGLLDPAQQAGVVNTVRERLLTPFGLRTLDPADPAYEPRYEGDLMQRDRAYHQGTVWPWLIGAYGEAVLRTAADPAVARETVRGLLGSLLHEHRTGEPLQIAEVYDGDAPHRPGGCIAQAWSVAEVRRLLALVSRASSPAAATCE